MNINSTLLDAKLFVLGGRKKGVHCPACGQYAKIYPRTIHKNMARGLLDYYRFDRRNPGEFMHVSECCNHESSQLIWWDLLEEELILRPDGGRAGYWRVTPLGRRFVMGFVTVPRNAMVYNETVLRYEGVQWSIHDALGYYFDLNGLL